MPDRRRFALELCATLSTVALVAAGCGSSQVPPSLTGGGGGMVVPLQTDGGAKDASQGGGHSGAAGVGGAHGSAGAGGGAGGHAGTSGSSTGGSGGVSAGTGGVSATGGAGTVGGGGMGGAISTDDACTACEKAKCSHPRGLTSNTTEKHALLAGAYEVCFTGTGWPTSVADPAHWCGGLSGEMAATAVSGPQMGMPKTQLCQALLKCIHRTNCTGGEAEDAQTDCYCGAGVDPGVCQSAQFTPTGQCLTEVAAALEVEQFSTAAGFWSDACLANGAAFDIYDFCDSNCCVSECLGMQPNGTENLTYCNATTGATGGTTGSTGGTTGTGGTSATGGTTGSTGGTTGTGGTSATGGTIGTGGTTATGGTAGAAGAQGAGGSTAAGGASGSGGTSPPSLITNGTFDTDTSGWTAGFGVTLSRSTNDAKANSASGSLDVSFVGNSSQSQENGASQCISATGGSNVSVGADILVPGQMNSQGIVALWFYGTSDCSGTLTSVYSAAASVTNGWQHVMASTQVPAGAHSMFVRLLVLQPAGQQSAEALFDNVAVAAP